MSLWPVHRSLVHFAAPILLAGCATTENRPRASERPVLERSIVERTVETEHLVARARFLPLGVVPYDISTLPLISPDGRFVATQFGAAPPLATRNAADGSIVPEGTRVAIFRLEARDDANQELPLVLILNEPLLLGRSCDDRGFLVESVRENGARWIGYVSWESPEIQWIVQDDNVNAFAALGPDDRLAWSRRAPEDECFELVVRIGPQEFALGDVDTDWLAPTWSETGDGLFAASLREGELSAAYLQGFDRATMLQSIRSIRLAYSATITHALDMVSGHPAVVGDPQPDQPMFLFAHPADRYSGVALWRPLRRGDGATQILDPKAYAAGIDPSGFVFLGVEGRIEGFPLDEPDSRIQFARQDGVPRTTTSTDWPVLLITPLPEQPRLRIIGMQAVALR